MSSDRVWKTRFNRIAEMSGAEMWDRTLQEFRKRSDLVHFYLKRPAAVRFRKIENGASGHFFFYPEQVADLVDLLQKHLPEDTRAILARAERICARSFDLLGYEDLKYGAKIDWHLDPVHGKRAPLKPWHKIRYLDFAEVGDVKVIWELNRHQHLVTLAKAYLISGDERFVHELLAQWYDWVGQNPYPIGVNWVSSLEVGFRVLSWLWVKHLLAASSAVPQKFEADLLNALAISGRHIEQYLSTFFSPNTHLLGEGVALFFLGTLCPQLSPSENWKQLGWGIVLNESQRQVRPDGMHFEQSIYYHVYALDFFLHALLLAARNEVPIPEHVEKSVEKMMEALYAISTTGAPFTFGDDDGGRLFDPRRNRSEHLMDPLATGAVLFGREDFKASVRTLCEEALWLVGGEGVGRFDQLPESPATPRSTAFRRSGIYLMATGKANSAQLLIDAGPQGALAAGHGHADALSIQLAQAGQMVLIDPGTCEYVGDGPERDRFRGTASHNTLVIDGLDQSEPKGAFSWGKHAETRVHHWIQAANFDLFEGSHNGYERLAGHVVHRRLVFFLKPEFWLVRDVIEGSGTHALTLNWHLGPDMVQHKHDDRRFVSPECGVALIPLQDSLWRVNVTRTRWSPVYGVQELAPLLSFEHKTVLPAEFVTVLVPTKTSSGLGTLFSLKTTVNSQVHGYRYTTADHDHSFFFSGDGEEWNLNGWATDAEFLYLLARDSQIERIILCHGTRLSYDGRDVMSMKERIEWCELPGSGTKRVISPQADVIVVHQWPTRQKPGDTPAFEALNAGRRED